MPEDKVASGIVGTGSAWAPDKAAWTSLDMASSLSGAVERRLMEAEDLLGLTSLPSLPSLAVGPGLFE